MLRTLAAAALITLASSPLYAEDVKTLSLTDAVPTLDDEFKEAPVWREGGQQVNSSIKPLSDESFSWAAGYIWNHPPSGAGNPWPVPERNFPAWTSNNLGDSDPNGDMITKLDARSPLTWANTLNFTLSKMPDDLAATIEKDPKGYLGAVINSFPYSQLYGVFAILAKLPVAPGVWPAFWLLPADKSWPPEIDAMEMIGREPNTLYTTVHTNDPKKETAHAKGTPTGVDLSAGFHEYAVDWGPEKIDWYFDGKLVFSQPTPADLHKPCYIIANIGAGRDGAWGGAPDDSKLPVTMQVAYIKAWQRSSYPKE